MSVDTADAPVSPQDKERLRLWLKLLKATRTVEHQIRENFKREFETTLPRFDVLAALSRFKDGLKMSEISGLLRVSNGNVTGIVDRLAQEGLLMRVPVPGDRRASLVRLTRRGEEEFARQATAHQRWTSEIFARFSAEEAQALATQLMAILPNETEHAE